LVGSGDGQSCTLREAAALGESSPRGKRPPLAVYTVHGMGKQVRFEEIDKIVGVLRSQAKTIGELVSCEARVVKLNGRSYPRADVVLRTKSDERVEVHVYEAYWAPATEGKVTLKDAIDFLAQAGWDGYKHSKRRTLRRWAFGGWQEYPLRRDLPAWFLFMLAVLAAMVVVNGAILALLAGSRLLGAEGARFGPEVLFGVSALLALVLVSAILMGISTWGDGRRRTEWIAAGAAPARTQADKPFGRTRSSLLFVATLTLLAAAAVATSAILARPAPYAEWFRRTLPPNLLEGALATLLPWGVLLASAVVARLVRNWLVGYIGDLAVYLSAHRSSKFDELREEVKERACRVLRDIYTAREGDGAKYPEVVVVSHSLGSVVAYDALNSTIREQVLDPDAFPPAGDVASRTRLFLTAGSPLNTTAFLFRTQVPGDPLVREMLAATMQPLLLDPKYRPRKWVNVHTTMDPIGGALGFYDPKDSPEWSAPRIENVVDRYGIVPFGSHSHYFDNPPLQEALIAEILQWHDEGRGPATAASKVLGGTSEAAPHSNAHVQAS